MPMPAVCKFCVPTGIATDSNTQEYFRTLVEENQLSSLYDFVNRKGIFSDVHKSYKFSLLTIFGTGIPQDQFDLAFYLEETEDLQDETKRYTLTPEDIESVNPNTRTCPTFRTKDDAETTLRIYNGATILKHEDSSSDDWNIEFSRMFNAGDDSHLFERKEELEEQGLELNKNIFEADGVETRLPVYESKMMNQFDHRFATYEGVSSSKVKNKKPREMEPNEKDAGEPSLPPYWIKKSEYEEKWNDDQWHIAIRNVTNATNRRTVISTILPKIATEHSINHMLRCDADQSAILVSCLNSYTLDYVARQKIGGENLSHYVLKQLPAPDQERLSGLKVDGEPIRNNIKNLFLKLVYTNDELNEFVSEINHREGPYEFTQPDGNSREEVRFKLEALICHVYGVEKEDFRQIFDSFEQIKNEDLNTYGYYRTRDQIKRRFEQLSAKITGPNHIEE